MKKELIILIFIISLNSYSQNEYYINGTKDVLTKKEIEEKGKDLADRISKATGSDMFYKIKINKTITRNDSIIHYASLNLSDNKKSKKEKEEKTMEGMTLPKFELETLLGGTFDSEKLKGKPTLINFWFTKCPPCIDEMPVLNEIQKRYKDKYNFISITYETKEDVTKFIKKHEYNFTHIVNAKEYIEEVLGLNTFPVNIFLDSKGVIQKIEGGLPYEMNKEGKIVIEYTSEFTDILVGLK
ncbi:MAG: TlpA family protein disulfide reductase [Flavobacteriaceae bacterium]|nr:TlpA family protein disulfide reductase [Flavobacteriaceae bacterium]